MNAFNFRYGDVLTTSGYYRKTAKSTHTVKIAYSTRLLHLTFHIIRVTDYITVANTTAIMGQDHKFTHVTNIYKTTVRCTDNKLLISTETFIPKRTFRSSKKKIQYSAVSSVL